MFLILNSVPVTSVTDPELIKPSIPVMTHSLDQKVVARKAKARKCAAEAAGNVQAKVERQHRLLISFSVIIPPSRSIPQRMCRDADVLRQQVSAQVVYDFFLQHNNFFCVSDW